MSADVMTRSQKMAQAAYARVQERSKQSAKYRKEYRSFAREFPTLVHQCGLAQAMAFALAKKAQQGDYADDLAAVLKSAGHDTGIGAKGLAEETRKPGVVHYVRLSRDALDVAVWLKRYVEALFDDKKTPETAAGPQEQS